MFAVLGDSSAVGLGVERSTETPGVLIAAALTELAERPVRLVRLAVSGAESRELDAQVDKALAEQPDVALIMIGANDVTSRTRPAVSVRHLADAVRRLPRPAARSSSAPAPTSARSARSPSRCAPSPASGAGTWPPRRRRRRRGRRPHGVAGLGPRPGVRLRPQHVQRRRVPPERGRLRPGRGRPAASVPTRSASGRRGRPRRAAHPPRHRAAHRAGGGAGGQPHRHRGPAAEVRGSDRARAGLGAAAPPAPPDDPHAEEMEESAETTAVALRHGAPDTAE